MASISSKPGQGRELTSSGTDGSLAARIVGMPWLNAARSGPFQLGGQSQSGGSVGAMRVERGRLSLRKWRRFDASLVRSAINPQVTDISQDQRCFCPTSWGLASPCLR
jgi:hypothetical protein